MYSNYWGRWVSDRTLAHSGQAGWGRGGEGREGGWSSVVFGVSTKLELLLLMHLTHEQSLKTD